VAALVIAVLPLVAWSGGCSSNVTTPDGGHGGGGAAGTASGGEGGTDGGVQCCTGAFSPSRRCTDDRHQLRVCEQGAGCGSTYSFVMKLMDCPNGCFPSDAATTNDDCPQ
jgi:hypothetical protein